MKLVEILAKELGEWPESYAFLAQEEDKEMYGTLLAPHYSNGCWYRDGDDEMSISGYFGLHMSQLATDHATAIVTREMWQAERDRADSSAFLDAVMALPGEDDPRTLRNRIREIDADIEAMTAERAELVSKLAGEGFALIAVAAEPVEDVSDWRNWKAGDLLEVVSNTVSHEFNIGEIVRYKKEFGSIGCCGKCELLDRSDWWAMDQADLKFHSRPTA